MIEFAMSRRVLSGQPREGCHGTLSRVAKACVSLSGGNGRVRRRHR
jgi:hypothetical protein